MCGRGADVWGHGGCVRGGRLGPGKGWLGLAPLNFFLGDTPVVPVVHRYHRSSQLSQFLTYR